MSIDNPHKHGEVDSDSMSDNHMDEKPPSEMPNEYTNLTQGYDALVFSTQQTGQDKNDMQFADYDLKESHNFNDKSYRRSFMN